MLKCLTAIMLISALLLAATPSFAVERSIVKRTGTTYPELAKRMRVTGTVRLEARVSPAGKVEDVKIVAGHPLLGAAAKEAVQHWEFAPLDNPSTERIDVEFK